MSYEVNLIGDELWCNGMKVGELYPAECVGHGIRELVESKIVPPYKRWATDASQEIAKAARENREPVF